jgi:hypothetical protein
METAVNCSCGGENERCYRCDGTGFVQYPPGTREENIFVLPSAPAPYRSSIRSNVRAGKAVPRAHLGSAQSTPTEKLSFRRCEHCHARFSSEHFVAHQLSCLSLWMLQNSKRGKKAELTLRGRKSKNKSRLENAAPLHLPPLIIGLVVCPRCQCLLNQKNLVRHMYKVHSTARLPENFRDQVTSNNPECAAISGTNDKITDLDASKYLGHFARDHGEYGSMPAHDDYSEEGDA